MRQVRYRSALVALALTLSSPALGVAFLQAVPDRTPSMPTTMHIGEEDAGWIPALYGNGRGHISPFAAVYAA